MQSKQIERQCCCIGKKKVVIKKFKKEEDWKEEVQILSQISHKNVLSMIAHFNLQSKCIVTPFMSHGTLTQYFAKYKPDNEVIRVTRDIISGLQEIHNHGIIHLDLKPDNIFIDQDGNAKNC